MSTIRTARCLLNATSRITRSSSLAHRPTHFASHRLVHEAARRSYTATAGRQKALKRDGSQADKEAVTPPQFEKKANNRSTSAKSTLRRIANNRKNSSSSDQDRLPTQICTAYCTAEKYNLRLSTSLLKSGGYLPDPLSTGLGDEVIHLRLPLPPQVCRKLPNSGADSYGDIFVFPSGNIVSWGIPEAIITSVAALIRPAAEDPHSETETETMDFVEDPNRSASFLRGDVITIGTGKRRLEEDHTSLDSFLMPGPISSQTHDEEESSRRQATPTVLAKIAFSSGLARSTKLAVLESMLDKYIESTSSIPILLSQGSRLPFTRNFILRKTGELLTFRGRLNLYSELTDSLPDIFWDSRKELGLEGYYESVGRELDVGVRIRQLNEKLDYASETAGVLRERLSERHGLVLEWMIIILITIEVGFEILHLWKDSKAEKRWETIEQENRNATPPPPPQPTHPYQGYAPPYAHQYQYQYPKNHVPQQQDQQPTDPAKRVDDIDAALSLLDGIIARAMEEERKKLNGSGKG